MDFLQTGLAHETHPMASGTSLTGPDSHLWEQRPREPLRVTPLQHFALHPSSFNRLGQGCRGLGRSRSLPRTARACLVPDSYLSPWLLVTLVDGKMQQGGCPLDLQLVRVMMTSLTTMITTSTYEDSRFYPPGYLEFLFCFALISCHSCAR